MKKYKVAVIQLDSQNNKSENLRQIERYIDEAVSNEAKLICLPEDMNLVGINTGEGGNAEELSEMTADMLIRKAKQHRVYIHGGSFHKRIPEDKRCYNTSLFLSPEGNILAEYHKIHTFDVTLPDGTVSKESEKIRPGDEIVTVDTELGKLGFSICYDVRFPELYRLMVLEGAEILFIPADFTDQTGKAHWEILLRARAIENGCYVIASDQCGKKPTYLAHGNSMIIDPWGNIDARAGQEPGIIYGEVDLEYIKQVREKIPSVKNRREDIYRLTKG